MPKWDVDKVRSEFTTHNQRKFYKHITSDFLIASSTIYAKNRTNDLRIPANPVFILGEHEVHNLLCNCNKIPQNIEQCPHLTNKVLCDLLLEKYRKIEALLSFFIGKRNISLDGLHFLNVFKKNNTENKMESSQTAARHHFHLINHIQEIIPRPSPELSKEEISNLTYTTLDENQELIISPCEIDAGGDKLQVVDKNFMDGQFSMMVDSDSTTDVNYDKTKPKNRYKNFDLSSSTINETIDGEDYFHNSGDKTKRLVIGENDNENNYNNNKIVNTPNSYRVENFGKKKKKKKKREKEKKEAFPNINIMKNAKKGSSSSSSTSSSESSISSSSSSSSSSTSSSLTTTSSTSHKRNSGKLWSIDISKGSEETETSTTSNQESRSKSRCKRKKNKKLTHKQIVKMNSTRMKIFWGEMLRMINRYNLSIIQEINNDPCEQCRDFFVRSYELMKIKNKKKCSKGCPSDRNSKKSNVEDEQIEEYELFVEKETNEIKKNINDGDLDTIIHKAIQTRVHMKRLPPSDILLAITKNYKERCAYCMPVCHILTAIAEEMLFFEDLANAKNPNYEMAIDWLFKTRERIFSGKDNSKKTIGLLENTNFIKGEEHMINILGKKISNAFIDTQLYVQGMTMMLSFIGVISPFPNREIKKATNIIEKHNMKLIENNIHGSENTNESTTTHEEFSLKNEDMGGKQDTKDSNRMSFTPSGSRKSVDEIEESENEAGLYIKKRKKSDLAGHKYSDKRKYMDRGHKSHDIIHEDIMDKITFNEFKRDYLKKVGHKSKLPALSYNLALASGIVLSALKLFSFIISNSMIMMASTIDSCLDILSSLILLITSRIASSKKTYKQYPVGRKRIQTIGVLIFACIMSAFSLQILSQAIIDIIGGPGNSEFGIWPIITMACAVTVKLILMTIAKVSIRWLKKHGEPSDILEIDGISACAQDHINDMLSNGFGLVFGIVSKYVWFLDPLASMLLSLFIIYNWGKTAFEQIRALLGCGARPDFVKLVTYICYNFDSRIKDITNVVCYHTGTQITVELVLLFSPRIGITTFNDVANELKNFIEALPEVERCYVRVSTAE